MVEYIRTCSKGVVEVMVMEIAQVEERTTRALAAMEDAGKEKRRKVGNGESMLNSSTLVQITTEEDDSSDLCAATGAGSFVSGGVSSSYCSSNGSTEKLKFIDLEEGNVEVVTIATYDLDRRSSKPRNEFMAESDEPETVTENPSATTISRRTLPPEKMPPAAELEEFFAAAEKDLHKRFKDKYNYDIVNDTPLKGRFEWIQLKQ